MSSVKEMVQPTVRTEDSRVREVRAPRSFLGRVWTIVFETIAHPFSRSVIYFDRSARPTDDISS
jgi:hypothetical protein